MNNLKFKIKNFASCGKHGKLNSGFTLVELMVSVSVFALVMVISMGTIVTVMDANRKSQTLRAVMDNLNFTMEGMTRSIRFGSMYHCDAGVGNLTLPRDCTDNSVGASSLLIADSLGVPTTYKLVSGQIVKTIASVDYPVTSPDITVTSITFRVYGSDQYNNGANRVQPKVIIMIKGYSGSKPSIQTSFTLETTVSQRKLDFQ